MKYLVRGVRDVGDEEVRLVNSRNEKEEVVRKLKESCKAIVVVWQDGGWEVYRGKVREGGE